MTDDIANRDDRAHKSLTLAPGLAGIVAIGVMVLWASSTVVARAVHAAVPPIGLSFWRWLVATTILVPIAVPRLRSSLPQIRAQAGKFACLGFFMIGGGTLLFYAVQYTTATNATLVNATQPAVTAILVWLLLHDRPRPKQIIGILVSACGVAVTVSRADLRLLLQLAINPGDLLMLLAVIVYALYAVYVHRWIHGIDNTLILFAVCVAGTTGLLPFYLLETLLVRPVTPDATTIAAIAYLGVFPSLLAVYAWNRCIHALGANRAAIFVNLVPVFGALLAVVFLHERLYPYHLAGLLLIGAGITLVVRGGAKAAA